MLGSEPASKPTTGIHGAGVSLRSVVSLITFFQLQLFLFEAVELPISSIVISV
jgi:hypothetical protein